MTSPTDDKHTCRGSISDLELSTRTNSLLRNNGIHTIEDFLNLTASDIHRWVGAGRITVNEILNTQRYIVPQSSRLTQLCQLATEMNMLLPMHTVTLAISPDGLIQVFERKL